MGRNPQQMKWKYIYPTEENNTKQMVLKNKTISDYWHIK